MRNDVSTVLPTGTRDGSRSEERWFRGDLDGLRAVAIVLVVAYHVGLPGFSGGFIGVDVFFVISGFLITRKLLSEVDRTNRVGLLDFWGRRLRRLVPALALMLVVVLLLALAVQSALEWESTAAQARAAALYVSNFYFASQPTGYFGTDLSGDLFLHTWSLGVEEQFYVLWPLLFLGVGVVTRRRRAQRRVVLGVLLGVIFVGSAILSQMLVARGSSMAFFGLASRAWEFAAAGLLALVVLPGWVRRSQVQSVMVVLGLGAIAVAALMMSSAHPYPGYRAALPVGGTILVLAGGEAIVGGRVNPVSALLATAPMRWLGRVSYSWYLWHWPLILLAVEVVDRDTTKVRLAGAGAALGVAVVAHHFVENPIRFNPRVTASRVLTYGGAVVATIVVLVACVGVTKSAERTIAEDPLLFAAEAAVDDSASDVPCAKNGQSGQGLEYCIEGDPSSDRTVVLFGDSHAGQWRVAFDRAAQASGVRLVTIWRAACPSIPVVILSPFNTVEECQDFHRRGAEAIAELDPELVVLANSTNYSAGIKAFDASMDDAEIGSVWASGYRAFLDQMTAQGTRVASVDDNPISVGRAPAECISETRSAEACTLARDEALAGPSLRAAEAKLRADRGISTFSVVDDLCDARSCSFVLDDTLVLGDETHLTKSFTLLYVEQIEQFLRTATA